MAKATRRFEVFTAHDIFAGVILGSIEFLALPRVGEGVSLLPSYVTDEAIQAGCATSVRVLDVVHTPISETDLVSLELDSLIVHDLTQALAVVTYLTQELSMEFYPSEHLIDQYKPID